MNFDVKGPYVIKRYGPKKLITDESLDELKISIGDDDLISGCGCYVFAIRAGKGYTPWYVGQASKTKLLNEAMNSSNREKYNMVSAKFAGNPVLFLLPKRTKGGKLASPTEKADGNLHSVNFLEEWLIATALQKNPNLVNKKKTFFLKNLHVKGIFNPKKGEATLESGELKKALFK